MNRTTKMNYLLATVALTIGSLSAWGQAPAAAPAAGAPAAAGAAAGGGRAGGGGGGRGGGIPGVTAEQTAAIAQIGTDLMPQTAAVTAARTELATATFAEPRSDNNIKAAVEKVRQAELALANARADAFGKLQAGANKLSADQIASPAFITTMSGGGGAGGRGGAGGGGGARGGAAGAAPAAGGAAPAAGAPAAGGGAAPAARGQ